MAVADRGFPAVHDRRRHSLTRNFWSTVVGNAGYAGCQWGMLIVLAKLCSPEAVGQFAVGFAVAAPVFMFTNLQLRAVLATDVKGENGFSEYLGLRVIATCLGLAFVAVAACFAGYGSGTAWIILAVGLAKGIESISDVYYGVFQQRERMDRMAVSTLAKGILSLGALAALTAATGSVLWGTMGISVAGATVLVFYDMRAARSMLAGDSAAGAEQKPPAGRRSDRQIWKLARLALPLGFVAMLVSLNVNIPRYFIAKELGERELGIFSAVAYLMIPSLTIINALGQAAIPRLAATLAGRDSLQFRQVLQTMLLTAVGLGTAGVLTAAVAGRQLLTLLYRPEYAANTPLMIWILVAGGFFGITSVLGTVVTAMRAFRVQLAIHVVGSVVVLVCSSLLIERVGILGGALSLLALAIASTAAYALVAMKKLGFSESLGAS